MQALNSRERGPCISELLDNKQKITVMILADASCIYLSSILLILNLFCFQDVVYEIRGFQMPVSTFWNIWQFVFGTKKFYKGQLKKAERMMSENQDLNRMLFAFNSVIFCNFKCILRQILWQFLLSCCYEISMQIETCRTVSRCALFSNWIAKQSYIA